MSKDKHMVYSATARCECGLGLAYDDTCIQDPFVIPSYWDCSGILLGTADKSKKHTGKLPFSFYEIKAEGQGSAKGATTRPKEKKK